MANQVHPDKRIDDLEKRLAIKDKELTHIRKSLEELSRRLAALGGTVAQHSSTITRIART